MLLSFHIWELSHWTNIGAESNVVVIPHLPQSWYCWRCRCLRNPGFSTFVCDNAAQVFWKHTRFVAVHNRPWCHWCCWPLDWSSLRPFPYHVILRFLNLPPPPILQVNFLLRQEHVCCRQIAGWYLFFPPLLTVPPCTHIASIIIPFSFLFY